MASKFKLWIDGIRHRRDDAEGQVEQVQGQARSETATGFGMACPAKVAERRRKMVLSASGGAGLLGIRRY
ncbi:MAG: hypothetical protein A2X45_05285 [Lentisphaerae bacterium GWF2_50_93]|nr:MAG: hypothetical protein A2X45_05285 [Lentisphaerae bacterium GWF2_50_93]